MPPDNTMGTAKARCAKHAVEKENEGQRSLDGGATRGHREGERCLKGEEFRRLRHVVSDDVEGPDCTVRQTAITQNARAPPFANRR